MVIVKKHKEKGRIKTTSTKTLGLILLGIAAITTVTTLAIYEPMPIAIPNKGQSIDMQQVKKAVSSLNIPFTENQGQLDKQVAYYAQVESGTVYIEKNGDITYKFELPEEKGITFKEIPVTFKSLSPKGQDRTQTSINFLSPNEKNEWIWYRNMPNYQIINLGTVFENIDLNLKTHGSTVEKLLTVNPGGNVNNILFAFKGIQNLSIDESGAMKINTSSGDIVMSKPIAYQNVGTKKKSVDVAYRILDNQKYGFTIGTYDKEQPLIIDPLIGSTYLGGGANPYSSSYALEWAYDATIGPAPDYDIFVTGYTQSSNFPTENDYGTSYDTVFNAALDYIYGRDVFVARLSSDLTNLKAATYLGGGNRDAAYSIVYYPGGNGAYEGVYISGTTSKPSGIVFEWPTNNVYGISYSTVPVSSDGFVAQFDLTLQTLYASSLGPSGELMINANGLYADGVTLWSPTLTSLISFTTNYGGASIYKEIMGSTFDSAGNIYICGETYDNDMTYTVGSGPSNPPLSTYSDPPRRDAFVTKFNAMLDVRQAQRYLGGTGNIDACTSMSTDTSGYVYAAGMTDSTDFPTTNIYGTSYRTANTGGIDNFLTKMDSNLNLLASTYFGSLYDDNGINGYSGYTTVDSLGRPYLYGLVGIGTGVPTFPWSYDNVYNANNLYMARFNSSLTALDAFSYIGTNASSLFHGTFLTLPGNEDLIVAAYAGSGFPTTVGAYDRTYNGGGDAVIFRITNNLAAIPGQVTNLNANGGNQAVNLTWTAPSGGATSYIVEYGTVASGLFNLTCSTPSCTDATAGATVSGLTAEVPYQFRINAVNPYYTGPYSNTATATPLGVPTPPLNLAAISATNSASLTWDTPANNGGSPITGYIIRYGINGTCDPVTPPYTSCSSTTSAVTNKNITDLLYNSEYIFAAYASNINGESLPSNTATSQTATPPDPPTNLQLTTDNLITTATWVAPINNGGMPITQYLLRYGVNGLCDPTTPPYTNCSSSTSLTESATITGLLYNNQYIFAAYAYNAVGESDASDTATTTPSCINTVPYEIGFTSYRDGKQEIYKMNIDGSNQTRLTNAVEDTWNPSSNRSGRNIIFTAFNYSLFEGTINIMNSNGSGKSSLTIGPNDNFGTISPDGTKIAYSSTSALISDIYIMNKDGSGKTRLTFIDGQDNYPVFSPDGSKILFMSGRDGNAEIYIMNLDGSSQTRLTNSPGSDYSHTFSPDGSKILFISGRDGNDEIYLMNLDGSNQTRLTNNSVSDAEPKFNPDGTKIVYYSNSGMGNSAEIHVMNADGGNQTRLTTNTGEDAGARFSPDGNKIIFFSNRDGNREIYSMENNGINQTRLTNNTSDDLNIFFLNNSLISNYFCASQTISPSILSFTNIPSSFSFAGVNVSSSAQELYNNANPSLDPDANDLLGIEDSRNSGGFEVQVQSTSPFTSGTPPNIPLTGLYVATNVLSPAYTVPGTDTPTVCPNTDCGIIYESGITTRSILAPLDSLGLNLNNNAIFTSNFGGGPIVLMDGALPSSQGRNGKVYQFINFRLTIPAFQPEGNYETILTYTLLDSTT